MQSVLTSTAFLLLGGGVSQWTNAYTFDTTTDPSIRSTIRADKMHTIIPIMDANLSHTNIRESVMNAYRQAEPLAVDPLHRKIAGQIADVLCQKGVLTNIDDSLEAIFDKEVSDEADRPLLVLFPPHEHVFVVFKFGYRPTLDLIDELSFVLARDHPKSRYELMLYPDIAYDRPLLKALVAYGTYMDNGNMTGLDMLV
ncbi:MAG: hypothetical protein L0154_28220 [Chloroflexi bacterium]|nr:hypothetical protein [Chloroflexota bacterium]